MTQREEKRGKGSEARVFEDLRNTKQNLLVLLAVGVIGATIVVGLYFGIEVEKPTLEIQGVPAFVGNEASLITFRARDSGSGVDSIVATIEQAGVILPIESIEPDGISKDFSGTFSLSKAIPGLREGPATLRIEVKDRSLWRSAASNIFPIVVDSFEPSLQLLYAPRFMDVGGAGLFLYKAGDANLTSSGLTLGNEEYTPGEPAVLMDPDLLQSDLFAFIVAAPAKVEGEWVLFASDIAGHTVKTPLSIEIRSKAPGRRIVSEYIGEGALIRLLANLSQEAASNAQEQDRRQIERFKQELATTKRKGAIDFVSYLVATLREKELDAIRKRLAVELPTPRRWQGGMFTGPFALRVGFGDKVVLGDDQGEFVSWVSVGEVLEPMGEASAVVAPYAGIVRMAGRLGTLGEIVVVDHGAGLASVFYSLDQRHVFEGSVVSQGQSLADIGISGLHASRAARMLFLVNGQPVDPALWRQSTGIPFAVQGALNGIKSALGIESSSAE